MKLFIKYWIYYLRKLNWWSADDFGKIRAIVFWCEIISGIPGLTRVGLTAGCFHTLPREPGMSTLNRPRYRKLRPTVLSPSIISIIHTNTRPQDVFTLALSSSVRKSSVMLPAVFCLVFVHDNMTRIFNHCTSVVYLLNQSINIHNFSN